MQKEEVLKLEYLKINDDYTIATIVYQNDEILKRDSFRDYKLDVKSITMPEFEYPVLYLKGSNFESDNIPIIILNEDLEFVKEKVKKLNKKYGVPTKWCPNIDDNYYYISFGCGDDINCSYWDNTLMENRYLEKNLIFKTKEEAKFVANKMLENVDKYREEYQKQKKE